MTTPVHVLLVLTLVMPDKVPDKRTTVHEDSIAECVADAQEFLERGLPAAAKDEGAVAVMAGCWTDAEKPDL